MRISDHVFTMPDAPVFGVEDPFFDHEDGRLDADAPTALSPYGPGQSPLSRRLTPLQSHDARRN